MHDAIALRLQHVITILNYKYEITIKLRGGQRGLRDEPKERLRGTLRACLQGERVTLVLRLP